MWDTQVEVLLLCRFLPPPLQQSKQYLHESLHSALSGPAPLDSGTEWSQKELEVLLFLRSNS